MAMLRRWERCATVCIDLILAVCRYVPTNQPANSPVGPPGTIFSRRWKLKRKWKRQQTPGHHSHHQTVVTFALCIVLAVTKPAVTARLLVPAAGAAFLFRLFDCHFLRGELKMESEI